MPEGAGTPSGFSRFPVGLGGAVLVASRFLLGLGPGAGLRPPWAGGFFAGGGGGDGPAAAWTWPSCAGVMMDGARAPRGIATSPRRAPARGAGRGAPVG